MGFEVDETAIDELLAAEKPMAKPEGTGKKKAKKKLKNTPQVNTDIWSGYTESDE